MHRRHAVASRGLDVGAVAQRRTHLVHLAGLGRKVELLAPLRSVHGGEQGAVGGRVGSCHAQARPVARRASR